MNKNANTEKKINFGINDLAADLQDAYHYALRLSPDLVGENSAFSGYAYRGVAGEVQAYENLLSKLKSLQDQVPELQNSDSLRGSFELNHSEMVAEAARLLILIKKIASSYSIDANMGKVL